MSKSLKECIIAMWVILENREGSQMKKVMALMVLSLSLTVCINLLPTDVTYVNMPHIFEVKQNVADPGH